MAMIRIISELAADITDNQRALSVNSRIAAPRGRLRKPERLLFGFTISDRDGAKTRWKAWGRLRHLNHLPFLRRETAPAEDLSTLLSQLWRAPGCQSGP